MPKKQDQDQTERRKRQQRQQLIAIGAVGGVILLVFGVLAVLLIRAANTGPTSAYDQLLQTSSSAGFPVLGDSRALPTIVEFSAFGCSDCLNAEPILKQVIDKFVRTGEARVVFVLVPTQQVADVAAQADLCAGQQNRFWDMRDALNALPQNEAAYALPNLRTVAESIGADGSKVFNCVASGTTQQILTSASTFFKQEHGVALPTLMWSTDGSTWKPFLGDNNQPYTGGSVPFPVIERTLAKYYGAGG